MLDALWLATVIKVGHRSSQMAAAQAVMPFLAAFASVHAQG
jgi:hypothetical protein